MNNNLQEKILDLWVSDEETLRIIKKTNLSAVQFKKLFASKIFQYLLDVYEKKTKIGDCPVVFAMLTIFKRNNLSLSEVHHICDTFKLNLTLVLIEENEVPLLRELLGILRENFKGVLKSYMEITYGINIGEITIVNEGDYLVGETCTIDPEIPTIDSHANLESSFNASEDSDYVKNYINTDETEEEFEIIHDVLTQEILDDFDETNEMFFNLAVLEDTYTQKYHELLSNSIDVYISIFLDLLFFNKISNSLNELKYLIEDISIYSDEQLLIMKQLTESLMNNLIKWKEEVIDNHVKTIHYYDDAIIGDVEQLKVMISPEQNSVSSDGVEDLDEIFDF